MPEVLDRLRHAALDAFAGEPVAFAYLFGSHATGTATDRSDVDVAVHLQPGADVDTLDLRLRLAGALEERARVGPIEIVVLDDAPLALAGRALEQGQPFYCTDDVLRVRHASATLRRFHDFKIHEERSARERLARLAEGR